MCQWWFYNHLKLGYNMSSETAGTDIRLYNTGYDIAKPNIEQTNGCFIYALYWSNIG